MRQTVFEVEKKSKAEQSSACEIHRLLWIVSTSLSVSQFQSKLAHVHKIGG